MFDMCFFEFHTVADSIQIYDMYMMAYVHAISCDKMSLQHPSLKDDVF